MRLRLRAPGHQPARGGPRPVATNGVAEPDEGRAGNRLGPFSFLGVLVPVHQADCNPVALSGHIWFDSRRSHRSLDDLELKTE